MSKVIGVQLSKKQLGNILQAYKNKVGIQFDISQKNLEGTVLLSVTTPQYNRYVKSMESGKKLRIKLSPLAVRKTIELLDISGGSQMLLNPVQMKRMQRTRPMTRGRGMVDDAKSLISKKIKDSGVLQNMQKGFSDTIDEASENLPIDISEVWDDSMKNISQVSSSIMDKMDKSGRSGTAFRLISKRLGDFDIIGLFGDAINAISDAIKGKSGWNNKQATINHNMAVDRAREILNMDDDEQMAVYNEFAKMAKQTKIPGIKLDKGFHKFIKQKEKIAREGKYTEAEMLERHRQKMGLGITPYGGRYGGAILPYGGMINAPYGGSLRKKKNQIY